MDQRLDARIRRSLRHIGGTLMVESVEIACQYADQIDDDAAAGNGARHAGGLADVGGDELHLPQPAERLDPQRGGRIALGDSHPCAARQQRLCDLTTDKAAAAEYRNQIVLHHLTHIRFERGNTAPSLAPAARR